MALCQCGEPALPGPPAHTVTATGPRHGEGRPRPADMVIADLLMPGMGGSGLIRRLRQTDPELRGVSHCRDDGLHQLRGRPRYRRRGGFRRVAETDQPAGTLGAPAMDGEPVTRDVTTGVASLHPVGRRPAGAGFSSRNDRVVPTFGGPLPVGRVGVIRPQGNSNSQSPLPHSRRRPSRVEGPGPRPGCGLKPRTCGTRFANES